MSTFQHKPDTGHLFKNDRKTEDSHPNAKGTALIGGVEYWLDSWTNTDKSGNKYQSLKFKRKEPAGAQAAPARPPRARDEAYRAGAASDEPPF